MKTHVDREIREWLEAEAAGRADEADRRFRSVSRRLAPTAVPAAFADAVMARLGAARVRQDAYSARWIRAAAAAGILVVGGVASVVPAHVWLEALLVSVQAVALGVGRVIIGGQAWVASGLALWGGLGNAAVVVSRQLMGPIPAVLLALNLAVALCAFGALRRLMALQEN